MKLHQTKEEWAEDLRDCSSQYIEIHSVHALEDLATLFAEIDRLTAELEMKNRLITNLEEYQWYKIKSDLPDPDQEGTHW